MGSGWRRPARRIPGTDLAGTVASVGSGATRFRIGDEVFGETLEGHQWVNGGSFAEFAAVPESCLALKPAGLSFAEAAAVPTSGFIALNNLGSLRKPGGLRAGHQVLINGAAGGVGGLAVGLAKAFGAEVTGVDHAQKLDLVRYLGADSVLDYAREDFTRRGKRYDLILDVASNLRLSDCRRALAPGGLYVRIGHDHYGKRSNRILGSLPSMLGLALRSPFDRNLPRPTARLPGKGESMETLRDLLASGRLRCIPVDRAFPLEEASRALAYLAAGTARGRIVLSP
jgi:NADPH:quinone reductase-like Zn-dependent oxidoreductase